MTEDDLEKAQGMIRRLVKLADSMQGNVAKIKALVVEYQQFVVDSMTQGAKDSKKTKGKED